MKNYTVEINAFGTKQWYFDGKLHREDGPAVEYSYGGKLWYLNGVCYETEAEWREKLNKLKSPKASCDNKVVEVDGVKYKLVPLFNKVKYKLVPWYQLVTK